MPYFDIIIIIIIIIIIWKNNATLQVCSFCEETKLQKNCQLLNSLQSKLATASTLFEETALWPPPPIDHKVGLEIKESLPNHC